MPFSLSKTISSGHRIALIVVAGALPSVACAPIAFESDAPIAIAQPQAEPKAEPAPRQETKRVTVTKDRLVITEKIRFKKNSAEIDPVSRSLIAEIGAAIVGTPGISRLDIDGHTCDLGSDNHNLRLSRERAKAVREALIAEGVADRVLEAQGYGETKPTVENDSDSNRERNRRVEFNITAWEEGAAPSPSAP